MGAGSLNGSNLVEKLLLQEMDINDPTSDPTDRDLEILSELCDLGELTGEEKIQASSFLKNYRGQIEEIVHSLSLEGPGVCIVEDVFSEEYMDQFQGWVDDYLTHDTSSKKDHFAFGSNKRVWRLPEKLPSSLLYTYLRYDACSSEGTSPVFNHVIDRFLGKHHIGSLAINQIQPEGAAQLTHTDFPPGFFQVEDLRKVFTGYALEKVMPYFSLQAGIALCDMDRNNGSTAVIPYSHAIQHSDWLIAGGKPKPGELITEVMERSENKIFFEAVQPYLVQARVKKGSCIFFNRKLLHQGGANHSEKPRTALLLQAIMPFGVKMEMMETEKTVDHLMEYVSGLQTPKVATKSLGGSKFPDEEISRVKKKYFGYSDLRDLLHYRLYGPRFPRDMDAAPVGEKNN